MSFGFVVVLNIITVKTFIIKAFGISVGSETDEQQSVLHMADNG